MNLSAFRHTPRRFLSNDDGAVSVQNVIYLVLFLAVGGLAVDVGNAYRMRTIMQAAADAGAHAGAQELPAAAAAETAALSFVEANMPAAAYGNIASATDISVGAWDNSHRTFAPGATQSNAVAVRLRRDQSRGNQVATFLLRFVGFNYWEIETRAIAYSSSDCVGIKAQGKIRMGQDVRIGPGVCVYGRNGISMGQDPVVHPDGRIGTLADPPNITTGQDPRISNDSLFSSDMNADRARNISSTINTWEAVGFPGYIVKTVKKLPKNLKSNTLYIVNGNVKFGQDYRVADVIIATRGNISFGQDGAFRNRNDCNNGKALGLYATGQIKFGQDARVEGVDLIAGGDLIIGQDVRSLSAHMETGGDARIEQDPHFTTCRPLFGSASGTTLVY
ncbi:hypothetical protein AIOL_001506 [Candidatus Rhodobacter oscarellae]|uniref:DUF2134 domain-containing protein n=1 Tax=Candidatus Rhodobacter oscarellae TaxID=1675527 RepID=A0A0J9E1I7_9RHOB|nr:TadG family pilus assembly protein [Candidatus Rhodobacter lobularis]KMW56552.1 hypothetical protein AIOL_001506 [Candidatus Rhodobacter lobularis]